MPTTKEHIWLYRGRRREFVEWGIWNTAPGSIRLFRAVVLTGEWWNWQTQGT